MLGIWIDGVHLSNVRLVDVDDSPVFNRIEPLETNATSDLVVNHDKVKIISNAKQNHKPRNKQLEIEQISKFKYLG